MSEAVRSKSVDFTSHGTTLCGVAHAAGERGPAPSRRPGAWARGTHDMMLVAVRSNTLRRPVSRRWLLITGALGLRRYPVSGSRCAAQRQDV